jgi:hypothetical protein
MSECDTSAQSARIVSTRGTGKRNEFWALTELPHYLTTNTNTSTVRFLNAFCEYMQANDIETINPKHLGRLRFHLHLHQGCLICGLTERAAFPRVLDAHIYTGAA